MCTCNYCGNARSLFYSERARGLINNFQYVEQLDKLEFSIISLQEGDCNVRYIQKEAKHKGVPFYW